MNIIYAQSRYDLLLLSVTIIYKEQHRDFKQKSDPNYRQFAQSAVKTIFHNNKS